MIPRYQKILFAVLLLAALGMGFFLWHLRHRAHEQMLQGQDTAPTQAPLVAPSESATLLVAYDADGSLVPQGHSLPLPTDPGARARALAARLLDLYASANASHPVPGGGAAVLGVFLMPAPTLFPVPQLATPSRNAFNSSAGAAPTRQPAPADPNGPQMAIINLAGSFANSHPVGIQPEMLTILSICGTLHANLPQITQVRFLVDGQQRATLAGHADLTRTYLTAETSATGARP